MNKSSSSSSDKTLKERKLSTLNRQIEDLRKTIKTYNVWSEQDSNLKDSLSRSVVSSFVGSVEGVLNYVGFLAKNYYFESTPHLLDKLKFAYKRGWIVNENLWESLVKSRHRMSHVYSGFEANSLVKRIFSEGYLEEIYQLVEVLQNE
ncbi:hypothetical protein [Paenibacillus aceti]|uniref:Nucleotidyltransferase n=1 Tax=Paenibacillus aceti TaxID=1820010 RepID=A0ABQ1VVD1_9BACL|nr:hypothetical protein [Paenibacillus aceti]GGF98765.1 hypothetical protein GCM10010913_20640 [Paenibacillus aceti]